jgi:hypothetical protein
VECATESLDPEDELLCRITKRVVGFLHNLTLVNSGGNALSCLETVEDLRQSGDSDLPITFSTFPAVTENFKVGCYPSSCHRHITHPKHNF